MLGRLNLTSAVDNIFEPRVNYCDKHISKIQPMAFLGVISAYTMINSTVLPVPPKPVFDHVRSSSMVLSITCGNDRCHFVTFFVSSTTLKIQSEGISLPPESFRKL